jgi:hypothetical protein
VAIAKPGLMELCAAIDRRRAVGWLCILLLIWIEVIAEFYVRTLLYLDCSICLALVASYTLDARA